MKKLLSLLSAITLCASAASCSKSSSSQTSRSEQSVSTEQLSGVAYRKSSVELPSDMNMIYGMRGFDKDSKRFILGTGKKSPQFWIADKELNTFTDLDIPDFRAGRTYDYDITDDGTLVVFLVDADYGDLPEPDLTSPDFDAAKYDDVAEYYFRVMSFSPEGKLLTDNKVSGCEKEASASTFMQGGVASDGKTVVASINGTYEVFTIEGKYLATLGENEDLSVESIGKNYDGELVCAVRVDSETLRICRISEDGSIASTDTDYKLSETLQGIIVPGNGEYSAIFHSVGTIYGIKSEDDSVEPLMNIYKSGGSSGNIAGIAIADDGDMILALSDYSSFTGRIKKYTPCDSSELENIPKITLGLLADDYHTPSNVDDFNDNCSDFQVEVKIYKTSDGDDAYDIADENIKKDALSGSLPDIIKLSGAITNFGNIDLVDMKAVYDLNEFMEKDDTLNRDAFVPNCLREVESMFDGGVYELPVGFELMFNYTAKEKFVKEIGDWNISSYLDILENMPEGVSCFYDGDLTYYDSRRGLISANNFIDADKYECHFDSPEFIRYIEFCAKGEKFDYDDAEEYEYDESAAAQQYIEQQRRYLDDRAMFDSMYVGNYANYIYETKGKYGGEPIVTLGELGGEKGKAAIRMTGDTFMITKTSSHPELAWEYIKSNFTDGSYKVGDGYFMHFPATKSGMEIMRKTQKGQKTDNSYLGTDYDGIVYETGEKDENGDPVFTKLGYVDDKVIAEVDGIIESAVPDKDDSLGFGDFEAANKFYNMINEEIDRYYNGECSANECAKVVQDRCSTYLSEKFG